MSDYILSTAAEFDLDEIWEYIVSEISTPPIAGSQNCLMRLKPSGKCRSSSQHYVFF